MKKQIALSLGLAVISTSALATKARMIALGETEDQVGSLYFSDNRNMFLNSAYVNEYRDFVTFEMGKNGNGGTKKDTDVDPQAEGGVFKSFGNYTAGVYLGAESYITHEARQYLRLSDPANPKMHQDNQIDVFFGGNNGVKWGSNLTYSKTNDDSNKMDQKSLSARFGMIADKFEAFANVALMNKAELNGFNAASGAAVAGKDEFEGKLGFELGGNYKLANELKVFAFWRHAKFETDTVSPANLNPGAGRVGPAYQGKADYNTNKYRIGAGREHSLNDKAKLFTKLEYVKTTRKVESDNKGDAKLNDYSVPLTVGLEYDANSWLTLRGSVYQALIGKADNDYDSTLVGSVNQGVLSDLKPKKRTLNNTTNVNAGATLKFGNLNIDGLIGTGTGAGTITDSKSEQGNFTLDNLMTRVAMTYRF